MSTVCAEIEVDKHTQWGPRMKQVLGPLQALAPEDTELMYDSIKSDEKETSVWVWYQPGFGQWFMNVYLDKVEISTDEDDSTMEYRVVPDDQVVIEFSKWIERNYEPKTSLKRKQLCADVVRQCVETGEQLQKMTKVAKQAAEFKAPDGLDTFVRVDHYKIQAQINKAKAYDVTREAVRMITKVVTSEAGPITMIPSLRQHLDLLAAELDKANKPAEK